MRIDTDQIGATAQEIKTLNEDIKTLLEKTKTTVSSLENSWKGEAATSSIEAYRTFSEKYFQSYYDVINQYVVFLDKNVKEGYQETERANINISKRYGDQQVLLANLQ